MTATKRPPASQSRPPRPHVELNGIYYPVDTSGPAVSRAEALRNAADIFEAIAALTDCIPETDPGTDEPLPLAEAP